MFALMSAAVNQLVACPFCSAVNLTFTEQLKSNDVVVIAKLLEIPPPSDDPDAELPKAQFEITDIIKGEKWISDGMKFRTLLVGRYPIGQEFMVMGVDPPSVAWSTPQKASERLIKYLKTLETLPKGGPERLEFFQDYFEDKESVLAFDAYDEFARAPYEDLIALKDKMDYDQIIEWIKDPETSINRRRLYFTMLGVCGGKPADIEMLEGFIKSGSRKQQAGLDALIACYLNLTGEKGVQLIEDTFIKDMKVDYVDTLAAVSALRFHGTEVDFVPKERIVAAIRHLLDRPKMADMIIPDLARWEDWTVMDRLVQMFKDADEDTNWLRVPVITYLRACPDPKAKEHIAELSKIDPDAVRRADFFLDFGDDEFGDDEDEDESDEIAEATSTDEDTSEEQVEEPKASASGGSDELTFTSLSNSQLISTSVPEETHVVKKVPIDSSTDAMSTDDSLLSSDTTLNALPSDSMAAANSTEGVAQRTSSPTAAPAPVATAATSFGLTMTLIFVPMAISLGIFLLLWSVISGWFERLIV